MTSLPSSCIILRYCKINNLKNIALSTSRNQPVGINIGQVLNQNYVLHTRRASLLQTLPLLSPKFGKNVNETTTSTSRPSLEPISTSSRTTNVKSLSSSSTTRLNENKGIYQMLLTTKLHKSNVKYANNAHNIRPDNIHNIRDFKSHTHVGSTSRSTRLDDNDGKLDNFNDETFQQDRISSHEKQYWSSIHNATEENGRWVSHHNDTY